MKAILSKTSQGATPTREGWYWFDTGDVSGIRGNVSGIRGNITGITGDVTGITGNVDMCEITDTEREAGVYIRRLVNQ